MRRPDRRRQQRVKEITPEAQAISLERIKKQLEEQKAAAAEKALVEAKKKALMEWDMAVKEEARKARELEKKIAMEKEAAAKAEIEAATALIERRNRRIAQLALLAAERIAQKNAEEAAKAAREKEEEEAHKAIWAHSVLKRMSTAARNMFLVSGFKDVIATRKEMDSSPDAFRVKWEMKARKSVDTE